jgi:hypothetical protein
MLHRRGRRRVDRPPGGTAGTARSGELIRSGARVCPARRARYTRHDMQGERRAPARYERLPPVGSTASDPGQTATRDGWQGYLHAVTIGTPAILRTQLIS